MAAEMTTRPRARRASPGPAQRRREELRLAQALITAELAVASVGAEGTPWVVRRRDGSERVIRFLDPGWDEPVEVRSRHFPWRRRQAAVA